MSMNSSVLFRVASGVGPTPISTGPSGGFWVGGEDTMLKETMVATAKMMVSKMQNLRAVKFNLHAPAIRRFKNLKGLLARAYFRC
jgi:hypothetical protein